MASAGREWWGAVGEVEVAEDGDDDGGGEDGGEEAAAGAAVGAQEDVEAEGALEEGGPVEGVDAPGRATALGSRVAG